MSPRSEPGTFELIEIDEDHAKARAFNMLFMVWRKRTLADAYGRSIPLARELIGKFPEGIGISQVVEVDAVPPDSDARTLFSYLSRLDGLVHLAVIHDGVGFKAAAVRAIMTGVQALARPKCKLTVVADVNTAAQWHAAEQALLGRRETAEEIAGIVRSLRRIHRDRYPR
jgi:hypothetical protein